MPTSATTHRKKTGYYHAKLYQNLIAKKHPLSPSKKNKISIDNLTRRDKALTRGHHIATRLLYAENAHTQCHTVSLAGGRRNHAGVFRSTLILTTLLQILLPAQGQALPTTHPPTRHRNQNKPPLSAVKLVLPTNHSSAPYPPTDEHSHSPGGKHRAERAITPTHAGLLHHRRQKPQVSQAWRGVIRPYRHNGNLKGNERDATILCYKRLAGYLHACCPTLPPNFNDQHLALATLKLVYTQPNAHSDIAHIALYGTGLYGEKPDEYLTLETQKFLVGDLLYRLFFHRYTLEENMLRVFNENRDITLSDFYTRMAVSANMTEDRSLADFYNQRYLFQAMPILAVNPLLSPEEEEFTHLIVGSPIWFLLFLGAHAGRITVPEERSLLPTEMIKSGIQVLNNIKNTGQHNEIIDGLPIAIKLAGLFLNRRLSPETLPDMTTLWSSIIYSIYDTVNQNNINFERIKQAIETLKTATAKPWMSRTDVGKSLLNTFCGSEDAALRRLNSIGPIDFRTFSEKQPSVTFREFLYSKKHVYCVKNKLLIKIPTVPYRYKTGMEKIAIALRDLDIALLNTLFTKSEFYDRNFRYENYDFIVHGKLKVIDPTLSLKRSVYDAIYSNKIISWKPYKKYIFFNATRHGETRTFYATDILEDLRLQQINFTAPLTDYIPLFESDPSFPPHRLKLSYSGLIANPEKSPQENVSLFVERIAVSRYDVNKKILYNQGLEIKWEDEVRELAKEIFIPFYSCIRGVEIEDPNQIVIDCTIDIVFTARPFLKGVVKATRAFAKTSVAAILERIFSAPRFLSKGDSITLNAVKLKNVITSQYIKTRDLEKLTFDLFKLFAEAFDPGLMALYDLQHGAYHALKSISRGNPLPLYALLFTKGKEITEVIIQTKTLFGIRQSMIKVSQTYSRGTTFTQYPTLSASASSDIFHMQIDGGDYNAFSVSNQTYVMSGDTGEISNDGHRVFAMIDVKSGMGILLKFICVQNPQVPGCTVIPWHPSSDLADSIIRPLHIKRNKHRQQWVFDLALANRTLSYYPGHSAMIVGDDSQGDRIYEIFEIDHAYFLFNPDTGQIRAMQAGDILYPFEKNRKKGFYKIRFNRKGRLVVQKNRKAGHWPKRKLAPYALATRNCLKRKILLHDNINLLIGKMYQACVILNLDPIKNHFRIETKHRLWPAIKVGWSEINSMFMPIKPNNCENSLAVSIDLDDYMLKQARHCQGILPQSFPIQLLNGAVMLKGEHWLKIHGHYHHLGEWQGEYRVLYCGNTTQIATWLRYEPLTENFEIVASPFGQRSLSDVPVSSYLSRMVNRLYPEDDWPTHYSLADVHDSFLSGDDLSLRLRQTALLQRLAPGERMALLSLPSTQIYSWSMHPDAMALRSRYPVLSLWLSWQCQISPLLNSTTTPSMRLEKTLTLSNAYINGKEASGSLSAGGYGSHDAIWIQHRAKENSNITLPTAYRLFHSEDIFYGEVIAGTQGMSSWFLEINDTPLPTVTQFSYEIKPQAEITTDIYRRVITFYTPYLGTFTLDRSPSKSKIVFVAYAPNYSWFATLDEERYISLYRVNSPEKIYSDHFDNVLTVDHGFPSPDDVDTKRVTLSFIDNAGRYFYSDGISWRNAVDKQYIWQPEQGFSPLFVSPEHDFLGYGNEDNATLLLFQVHRGYSILLQSFSSAPKHNRVTAIAFSPLNVLVAIAYSDDFVYVYNIADAKPNAVVYPLIYADLTFGISSLLNYWHNVPKSAVLRFEGVFTHLKIIHDVHNVSDTGTINNSSYLYQHFLIVP